MVITISNEYGAHAIAISANVAAQLGYDVIDRELPVVVAKRMNVSPEDVEAAEYEGRSLGDRLLSSLELSTPEVTVANLGSTFDEACFREVEAAVREYATHGNVVLIGRGAAAILGRRPGVLRVFMHAPRDWRIENIVRDLGVDRKTAQNELDRIDRARRAYIREWYDAEWGAAGLCDLSIDTSSFGEDGSAALVVAAVKAAP